MARALRQPLGDAVAGLDEPDQQVGLEAPARLQRRPLPDELDPDDPRAVLEARRELGGRQRDWDVGLQHAEDLRPRRDRRRHRVSAVRVVGAEDAEATAERRLQRCDELVARRAARHELRKVALHALSQALLLKHRH
jgi:hypothetical protein